MENMFSGCHSIRSHRIYADLTLPVTLARHAQTDTLNCADHNPEYRGRITLICVDGSVEVIDGMCISNI